MKKFKNILVVGGTMVLAVIAVSTGYLIYRADTTAPEDSRASQNAPENVFVKCTEAVITFVSPSASPSTSPSASPSISPSTSPSPSISPSSAPSSNPSSAPTASATSTPSSIAQATKTPTVVQTQAELPNAGVSMPTILGISAAVILLLGAALLAI